MARRVLPARSIRVLGALPSAVLVPALSIALVPSAGCPSADVGAGAPCNEDAECSQQQACLAGVCTFSGFEAPDPQKADGGSPDEDGGPDPDARAFEEDGGAPVGDAGSDAGDGPGDDAGDAGPFDVGADAGTEDAGADAGPEDAGVLLVADDFDRDVDGGWGDAPLGGPWDEYNPAGAALEVEGGVATVTHVNPGAYSDYTLHDVDVRDVELRFSLALSQLPTNGSYSAGLYVRNISSSYGYQVRLRFTPAGVVTARLTKGLGGDSIELVPESPTLEGYQAGARVFLSLSAAGADSTRLCAKIWRAGEGEPAGCAVAANDVEPVLAAPGALGIVATISGAAAPVPVTFSFDDVRAYQIGPE